MDINRKRIAEEFRKKRIFNAKQRQIGLDVQALNYQVQERLLVRDREEERERKFAEEAKRQSDLEELLEQQRNEEIREKNKKITEFRSSEQRPEYGKDYDLNDPNQKKKERPPRTSDDEYCPVSGLQKFEGEDIGGKYRSRKQKDQVRDLLLQQMQEKRMQNFKCDRERFDWETTMLQRDRYAQQLTRMEREHNKEISTALSEENKTLATQKQESIKREKIADEIEKQKDIEFNINSDLLSENPSVSRSSFGPNRVVPDRWKGMSKHQLDAFYAKQVQQIEDKHKGKYHEQCEKAKWDEELKRQDQVSQFMEKKQKSCKRELNKKVDSVNEQLAQEQRRQQEFLNKVIYANAVSEDYFDQFNTTSR